MPLDIRKSLIKLYENMNNTSVAKLATHNKTKPVLTLIILKYRCFYYGIFKLHFEKMGLESEVADEEWYYSQRRLKEQDI